MTILPCPDLLHISTFVRGAEIWLRKRHVINMNIRYDTNVGRAFELLSDNVEAMI